MSDRTLIIAKPDAVRRKLVGEIIGRIEDKGLLITAMDLRTIDKAAAEQHYAEHGEKPFYSDLLEFITSGPSVVMVVEGPNAQPLMRKLMGATSPNNAEPGSIRGDFASTTQENLVHGSDSADSAAREIKIFFPELG